MFKFNKDIRSNKNRITVFTKDKELEEVGKKVELAFCVKINENKDSNIVIACNGIYIYSFNDDTYYIQIITKNEKKQEGFDSYIYCDDYKSTVLDLLNSLGINLISIDSEDLINITINKSFNHYRFSLIGPHVSNNIKDLLESFEINILNKKILVILYGNMNLSLKQIDDVIDYFRINKDLYQVAIVDDKLKDNELILSLLIER